MGNGTNYRIFLIVLQLDALQKTSGHIQICASECGTPFLPALHHNKFVSHVQI